MHPLPRLLRLLLIIILALLLLLAAGTGIVALLLGSEAGTRFVAGQVASRAGDTVRWSRLEGTLLGPLQLNGLKLSMTGLDLSIDDLYLSWSPRGLLEGRVQVDALRGQGIQLVLSATSEEPGPGAFNPGDISLPVAVELGNIAFSDLLVTVDGQTPVQIDSLELGAQFESQQLTLRNLAVRMPQGGFSLGVDTVLAASMPLEAQLSWDWQLALPETSADTVSGTQGMASLKGDLALEGNLQWDERTAFDLHYQLTAEGLQALDSALPEQVKAGGDIQGTQGTDELLLQQVSLVVADTPLALSLAGQVASLDTAEPRANLTLQWRGLNWPLQVQEADIASPTGSLTLEGTRSKYQLELAAELAGRDIPPGQWALAGHGDASQLVLEELSGQVLGGDLSVSGDLEWDPQPRWDLRINATGLDPGQLQPELPGSLALSLQTTGRVDPDTGPHIEVLLQDLSGVLLDHPLQGSAQASIQGEEVQLVALNLNSSGNGLRASGEISPSAVNVAWQLDASNPAALLEGADGEVSARGTITGDTRMPRLQAQARGTQLRFGPYSMPSLKASLAAGLNADDPLNLELDIGQVEDGEVKLLSSLHMQATGSMRQHRFNSTADTGTEQLSAQLNGGVDQAFSSWQGQLTGLSLDSTDFGKWTLAGPSDLSLAAEQATLGESCLQVRTGRGRVCVQGNWAASGNSEVQGRLQALPLDMFVPAVSGDIEGNLSAALAEGGELQVDSTITLGKGEVQVDDTRRLTHGGGEVSLRVGKAGLLARLQLAAPEQGQLQAVVKLPALNALPLADHQPLTGNIKAELPDLSGLAAWVPQLSRSAGRLAADVQLSGSLAEPGVTGKLALQDGAATLPLAGLNFEDIRMEAASDPSQVGRIALTGGMRSGPGQLLLTGDADLDGNALQLALVGDSFQAYNTRDARALVSPDLQMAWRDNTLNLSGQVTIPEADITPQIQLIPSSSSQQDLQGETPGQVIAPSPDVVVISEQLESVVDDETPDAPFRIDSHIRVQMGDDVRVNAVGFVSRITGAVDFTNTPEQEALIPMANGRFSLKDGTFRAFGQDLEIESGHLIFANVPATEPELNLRAVRWIDNDPQVTAAGVLVTGPLNQPLLELFSRPQLDTSEIQSYLLTGRSPRSKESVLGIGTYVSRKIYVGYGFNMLERTSEFNSLFNISPRYGVGTSVGEADNNINMTITYEH